MARKTFRFRMQRLLEVRMLREKQAQAELLTRQANLAREQHKLQQMLATEDELVERMVQRPGERLDIEDRVATEYALVQHRKKIKTQRSTVIPKHERLVAEQQDVLKQKKIDVKAIEKLRERHYEEFREEQLREEAAFLDDLASQQFIRTQRESERHAAELATATAGDEQVEDPR